MRPLPTIRRCANAARLAVACAALLLCACSAASLAYRNADRLMLSRLERFVELEPEQRSALAESLEAGLERHRSEALPALVARLRETSALVAGGLDTEGARRLTDLGRITYRDTALALIRDISPVLARLRPEQIEVLEARMAEENARVRAERLEAPPAERAQRRTERLVGRIEKWIGPLDDVQRALVEARALTIPARTEDWLRFSAAQQSLLVVELRGGASPARIERRLAAWWVETATRDAAYQHNTDRAVAGWTELMVDLDATLDADQRKRLVAKLDRYAKALGKVADEATPS
jgi:hypothetical protein